jgi:ABC-type uncharacterized transport system permease subunit
MISATVSGLCILAALGRRALRGAVELKFSSHPERVGFAQILLNLTDLLCTARQSNQALSARVWNLGGDDNSGQFWVQAQGLSSSVLCPRDSSPVGHPISFLGKISRKP